jgi:predicted nucleotidyltransferase
MSIIEVNNEEQRIVSYILSKVDAEKIILFGSRARGDFNIHSDYDILIIVKYLTNRNSILDNLYNKWKLFSRPIDFLVVDSKKYELLINYPGYIYKTINKEGKVLYDRSI